MVPLHVDGMFIRTFGEAIFDEDNHQFGHSMSVVPALSRARLSLGDILCLLTLLSENLLIVVHTPLLQEYH